MKKLLNILLTLLFIFLTFGCASTAAVSESKASNKVNTQNTVKLQFEDWKYKGFGVEVPDWVQPALEGTLNEEENLVFVESGINSDQSEDKLKLAVQTADLEEYVFYDSFWVKLSESIEMPYRSLAVYKK